MGLFSRAESYAKKRGLGSAVNTGWDSVQSSTKTLQRPKWSPKLWQKFWHGPDTEDEGRLLFETQIQPYFAGPQQADEVAYRLKVFGIFMVLLGFALCISAIFFSGAVYKIGAIVAFLILCTSGAGYIHRAEQLRQRMVIGMKDLFF